MNLLKLSLLVISSILVAQDLLVTDAFAQVGPGESPFERKYNDVKYP